MVDVGRIWQRGLRRAGDGGFGAGTLPALVGLSAAARPWAVLVPRLRLVTPLVVATVGFVLLMRGLLPPQNKHSSRHVAGVHLLHRP